MRCLKVWPQKVHLYGRSPVWMRRCCLRESWRVKDRPQCGQVGAAGADHHHACNTEPSSAALSHSTLHLTPTTTTTADTRGGPADTPRRGSCPAGRSTSWRQRSPAGGGSGGPTAGRRRSRSGCTRKAARPCGSSGADSGCPAACSSDRTRYTRTAAPRYSPPPTPGGHLHPPTARPHPPAATHTP